MLLAFVPVTDKVYGYCKNITANILGSQFSHTKHTYTRITSRAGHIRSDYISQIRGY